MIFLIRSTVIGINELLIVFLDGILYPLFNKETNLFKCGFSQMEKEECDEIINESNVKLSNCVFESALTHLAYYPIDINYIPSASKIS